jgi:hypothetical protein
MDTVAWLEWMQRQHHEPMFKKCLEELRALRTTLETLRDSELIKCHPPQQ